jgi:uncharacterized protein YcbK (DUF882 family)
MKSGARDGGNHLERLTKQSTYKVNQMATVNHKRSKSSSTKPAPKARLVRLANTAEKSRDKAAARDLRRLHTAIARALDHITRGFDRRYLEPIADQISRIAAEVAHG